ncbi:MAG: hypothetical protein KBF32_08645 [Chitinophagales bacterium]|nr:hypothetical protein [Chitinophagales bacterium]
MKNHPLIPTLLAASGLFILMTMISCKNENVVKPEDIQAYLDKGADLTITLPAGSTFDLVHEDGRLLSPGKELNEPPPPPAPPTAPGDTLNKTGGNSEKKFRHAGAFVQQAVAGTGAYTCPSVCSIIIRTPL